MNRSQLESEGLARIVAERRRQISEEGWDDYHDALHDNDELARAAATYAMPDRLRRMVEWPFDLEWWKPTPDNRIRELEKAGALIAAEIDRLLNVGWYWPSGDDE